MRIEELILRLIEKNSKEDAVKEIIKIIEHQKTKAVKIGQRKIMRDLYHHGNLSEAEEQYFFNKYNLLEQ